MHNREILVVNRESQRAGGRKRRFLAHLFCQLTNTICSRRWFADGENETADEHGRWTRQARRSGVRIMRHGSVATWTSRVTRGGGDSAQGFRQL